MKANTTTPAPNNVIPPSNTSFPITVSAEKLYHSREYIRPPIEHMPAISKVDLEQICRQICNYTLQIVRLQFGFDENFKFEKLWDPCDQSCKQYWQYGISVRNEYDRLIDLACGSDSQTNQFRKDLFLQFQRCFIHSMAKYYERGIINTLPEVTMIELDKLEITPESPTILECSSLSEMCKRVDKGASSGLNRRNRRNRPNSKGMQPNNCNRASTSKSDNSEDRQLNDCKSICEQMAEKMELGSQENHSPSKSKVPVCKAEIPAKAGRHTSNSDLVGEGASTSMNDFGEGIQPNNSKLTNKQTKNMRRKMQKLFATYEKRIKGNPYPSGQTILGSGNTSVSIAAHHIIPDTIIRNFKRVHRKLQFDRIWTNQQGITQLEAERTPILQARADGFRILNLIVFFMLKKFCEGTTIDNIESIFGQLHPNSPTFLVDLDALVLSYNPGNIFYGPHQEHRLDDPGGDFEFACLPIIGPDRFYAMEKICAAMKEFPNLPEAERTLQRADIIFSNYLFAVQDHFPGRFREQPPWINLGNGSWLIDQAFIWTPPNDPLDEGTGFITRIVAKPPPL